jgi:hypothetical protein
MARTDIDEKTKLERIKRVLEGDTTDGRSLSSVPHDWVEVGVDDLPETNHASPGQSIKYECRSCGAKGYRIVFPTSVTLYPIVSESPTCRT